MPDSDDQQQTQDNPAQLRAALDAANARAARLEAMATAGVDFTSPVGQLFRDGYAGDTTPEAIKAAWEAVAPSPAAPPAAPATPDATAQPPAAGEPTPPAAPPVDTTQTDLRRDLAANGGAAPPTEDPRDKVRSHIEERAKTVGRNNAIAEGVGMLVQAAAAGDKRVIVDVWGNRE